MTAKIKAIRSSWWEGYGYRLDCQPYLAGALETKIILEGLSLRKDYVRELTMGPEGGIYFAGREGVQWVDSPSYGVPFLRGKDILLADLSHLPLISKKQVALNPQFLIRKGMTLITRSGTIGRTAYVRAEMEGMACSDPLRVIPDPQKIPPGYLYVFLSSKFGISLVASGTYGAIIQHLEPEHIAGIPVPRLDAQTELEIHELVEKAADLRTEASNQIRTAQRAIIQHFGSPQVLPPGHRHTRCAGQGVSAAKMQDARRIDALYFNPVATDLDTWIEDHHAGYWQLSEIAAVFDVPLFKHIYVDPEFGVGFFTSADIFQLDKKPDKYLSRSETKGLSKYILQKRWVLLARSGSLGGNIAIPQFADSVMAGMAASDHVIRIVSRSNSCLPGYLYAYLDLHEIGYPLILRTATGACVPALWPIYLNTLKVLKPSMALNQEVNQLVTDAFEMRVEATKIEDSARGILEKSVQSKA